MEDPSTTDDSDNPSINSTAITTAATTTTETMRSTSSESEWTSSTLASPSTKPHAPSSDPCWDAIQSSAAVGLGDLRFVHRLGSGDIGSVYLVELKGCLFAAKVMDKKELVARNKESRARVERDVLEVLDHPFLPTLYATLESPRWSCLLTEFCPGGDLHVLRQRQPNKRFLEPAVRYLICSYFNFNHCFSCASGEGGWDPVWACAGDVGNLEPLSWVITDDESDGCLAVVGSHSSFLLSVSLSASGPHHLSPSRHP